MILKFKRFTFCSRVKNGGIIECLTEAIDLKRYLMSM